MRHYFLLLLLVASHLSAYASSNPSPWMAPWWERVPSRFPWMGRADQFFVSEKTPLPDAFTGRGRVTCDNPFHIISFYQTDLGGLTNNPTPGSVDAD